MTNSIRNPPKMRETSKKSARKIRTGSSGHQHHGAQVALLRLAQAGDAARHHCAVGAQELAQNQHVRVLDVQPERALGANFRRRTHAVVRWRHLQQHWFAWRRLDGGADLEHIIVGGHGDWRGSKQSDKCGKC